MKGKYTGLSIRLTNFVPLSTNHMYYYYPRKNSRTTYSVRSSELNRIYSLMTTIYEQLPSTIISSIKDLLDDIMSNHHRWGSISIITRIRKSRLLYSNGNLKKYDASNTIKAVEDAFTSNILQMIVSEYGDKYHTRALADVDYHDDRIPEYVEVHLSIKDVAPGNILSLGDVYVNYDADNEKYLVDRIDFDHIK